MRLLADQDVRIQPDQPAFVIEIDAASPRGPIVRGLIKELRGNRRILHTAPRAARRIEVSGHPGKRLAVIVRSSQPKSSGKALSDISPHPSINPPKVAYHR